jgi:hypothetical protein
MIIKSPIRVVRNIPDAELRKFDGKWIAVSADGDRVVAAADSLLEVDKLVRGKGVNPETLGYEHIKLEDSALGGSEML